MPTYQYACTECGRSFEVVQSFTDEALTECEACTGRLRKVFGSVGVVFKGSGFYRTDSREPAKNGTEKAPTTGDKAASGGGEKSPDGAKAGSSTGSDSGTKPPQKSGSPAKSTASSSPSTAGSAA